MFTTDFNSKDKRNRAMSNSKGQMRSVRHLLQQPQLWVGQLALLQAAEENAPGSWRWILISSFKLVAQLIYKCLARCTHFPQVSLSSWRDMIHLSIKSNPIGVATTFLFNHKWFNTYVQSIVNSSRLVFAFWIFHHGHLIAMALESNCQICFVFTVCSYSV